MTLFLLAAAALGLYLWLGLPATLRALGLHARYRGPHYRLPGKRALIVTTSQATLEPGTKATGVFGSEMTAPYYAFLDAGMAVDIASKNASAWFEPFADLTVVDGHLVTGQNQNAGEETAQKMLQAAGGTTQP